jgi:hypothetical protein
MLSTARLNFIVKAVSGDHLHQLAGEPSERWSGQLQAPQPAPDVSDERGLLVGAARHGFKQIKPARDMSR